MADAEVKQYQGFPRKITRDSITVDCGYDLQAGPLIEALAEALKKVPAEHHERAIIHGPDDYGDEWAIEWWFPESDKEYEARYAAHLASGVRRHRELRSQYRHARKLAEAAQTLEEKRSTVARLEHLENKARDMGCVLEK